MFTASRNGTGALAFAGRREAVEKSLEQARAAARAHEGRPIEWVTVGLLKNPPYEEVDSNRTS